MTLALATKPYIGPSESQSRAEAERRATDRHNADALAKRESQYQREHWESKSARIWRRMPTNTDAWVAWLAEQWSAETPTGLHGHDVWADHPAPFVMTRDGAGDVVPMRNPAKGVGGSLLGSPSDTGAFAATVSGHDHQRDGEGDLVRPFRSSLASLRKERPRTHDALMAVAWHGFAWRRVIDAFFYEPRPDGQRWLVMRMPEDVLVAVLDSGCERLWHLLAERLPHLTMAERG